MSDEKFGPWTLTESEGKRLKGYQRLQDLLGADAAKHDPLYRRAIREASGGDIPPHLWPRIPSLVCRTAADLILPEAPRVTVQEDASGTIQARIDALLKRSGLYSLSWRSIYWACAQGDAYLVVVDVPQKATTQPVITLRRATNSVARNIRAEDAPSSRQFLFKSCVGGMELFMEQTAGFVKWSAYKDGQRVEAPKQYTDAETRDEIPLVVPLTALRGDATDEAFGESDFDGAEDFCFEISNRLRQCSVILDRHAEPPMNVPSGTLDENSGLDIRRRKVFEKGVNSEGADYVTWQSQLVEAYNEIDRLTDIILLLTETPGALWGRDKAGEAASGRALKFKLLSGLGKARRTGGMFREALAAAVRLALRREDILSGRTVSEYQIKIELSQTVIADDMELAEYAAKLRAANLISTARGVELTQKITGNELDDEVARIDAEVSAAQTPPIGAENSRFLA